MKVVGFKSYLFFNRYVVRCHRNTNFHQLNNLHLWKLLRFPCMVQFTVVQKLEREFHLESTNNNSILKKNTSNNNMHLQNIFNELKLKIVSYSNYLFLTTNSGFILFQNVGILYWIKARFSSFRKLFLHR